MLILKNNELDCLPLASLMTSYFKNVELFSCMQIRLKIAIHSSLKYTLGSVKMSLWILREREREMWLCKNQIKSKDNRNFALAFHTGQNIGILFSLTTL